MNKKNVIKDFIGYILEEQESIEKAVLTQAKEEEFYQCEEALIVYLFHVRHMNLAAIKELNMDNNPYIKLINKELSKKGIHISRKFIYISM